MIKTVFKIYNKRTRSVQENLLSIVGYWILCISVFTFSVLSWFARKWGGWAPFMHIICVTKKRKEMKPSVVWKKECNNLQIVTVITRIKGNILENTSNTEKSSGLNDIVNLFSLKSFGKCLGICETSPCNWKKNCFWLLSTLWYFSIYYVSNVYLRRATRL